MRNRFMKFSASVLGVAAMASVLSCTTQQQESPMKAKVEEYAQVELKSDLVNGLNDKEKELVKIFFQLGESNFAAQLVRLIERLNDGHPYRQLCQEVCHDPVWSVGPS